MGSRRACHCQRDVLAAILISTGVGLWLFSNPSDPEYANSHQAVSVPLSETWAHAAWPEWSASDTQALRPSPHSCYDRAGLTCLRAAINQRPAAVPHTAAPRNGSVDVVVSRCEGDLKWLRNFTCEDGIRFVVYEKCPSAPPLLVPDRLRGCIVVSPLPSQIGASLTWLVYLTTHYARLPEHVVFAKDAVQRLITPFAAHLRAHLAALDPCVGFANLMALPAPLLQRHKKVSPGKLFKPRCASSLPCSGPGVVPRAATPQSYSNATGLLLCRPEAEAVEAGTDTNMSGDGHGGRRAGGAGVAEADTGASRRKGRRLERSADGAAAGGAQCVYQATWCRSFER